MADAHSPETVRQIVSQEFDQLQKDSRAVMDACGWDGNEFNRWPSDDDYFRIRTRALNLVRRACGVDSEHFKELSRLAEGKESATQSRLLAHFVGVIEAARHDFEAGLLFDVRALLSAELLGDFTDQAELLVAEGYFVPAASLVGAVLEDALRRLCQSRGVLVPEKTKIDRINADLAKAGVYDKLVQKRITAIADIRNNADHGRFDRFTQDDVVDMVKWIRRFTADYLR